VDGEQKASEAKRRLEIVMSETRDYKVSLRFVRGYEFVATFPESNGLPPIGDDYRFHGLPKAAGFWLARAVHFIMERKELLEIARRAEGRRQQGASYEPQKAS
jgi:hypothetical protein